MRSIRKNTAKTFFSQVGKQPKTAIFEIKLSYNTFKLLKESISYMVMDCVSGDVLTKKREYFSCKIIT